MSHGGAADGGGGELRAETTESVTGSSGGGVFAPPPDLEVARRRTRSRPGPARPGARPGDTLVLDAFPAVRPAQPGIGTGGAGSTGHPVAPGPRPRPAATRAGPAAPPAPGRVMF